MNHGPMSATLETLSCKSDASWAILYALNRREARTRYREVELSIKKSGEKRSGGRFLGYGTTRAWTPKLADIAAN